MDQTKALDMTAYLKSETEYVPWISALSSLGYIGAMLEGNPEYPNAYDYYEVGFSLFIYLTGRCKKSGHSTFVPTNVSSTI